MSKTEYNVLITGATGDIGSAVTQRFLRNENYNLFLTGSSKISLNKLKKKIKKESKFYILDYLKFNEKKFKFFIKQNRIDIFVNCAGIINRKNFSSESLKDWQKVNLVNLETPMRILKILISNMIKQKYGKIILLNSQMSKHVHLNASPSYSCSKASLQALTRYLATFYAQYNININGIMAGTIKTKMQKSFDKKKFENLKKKIPAKKLGSPFDLAELIHFLCQSEAKYINGANINFSGGSILD